MGIRLLFTRDVVLLNFTSKIPFLSLNKQIVTVHDLFVLEDNSWYSSIYKLVHRPLLRLALRRSLALLAVSDSTRQEILSSKYYRSAPIALVRNGVSSRTQLSAEISDEVLADLGLKDSKFVITPNWWDPRKNFSEFAVAWARLPRKVRESFTLICTGDPPSNVFSKANGDLFVKHLGHVSDFELTVLYSNADLLVFPSLAEGFGLPPLEALLQGCKVIISDIPALMETCGPYSFIFPLSGSVEERARILRLGLDPESPRIKESEIAILEKTYDWDSSYKNLLGFLNKEVLKCQISPRT